MRSGWLGMVGSCKAQFLRPTAARAGASGHILMAVSRRSGDLAVDLAKADAGEMRLLAPTPEDDGVTILQERAPVAVVERQWVASTFGQLDQRAGFSGRRTRDGAASEQVATLQIAAADGVVRYHLRDRPILMAKARAREPLRGPPLL